MICVPVTREVGSEIHRADSAIWHQAHGTSIRVMHTLCDNYRHDLVAVTGAVPKTP